MSVLLAARGPKEKEIRDAWVIEDRQRRLMYDSSERLERKKTRGCGFLISAIWLKGAQVMALKHDVVGSWGGIDLVGLTSWHLNKQAVD